MQSDPRQNNTDEAYETLNTTPTIPGHMLLVVCRLLPPNHLIPTEMLLLFLISRWDVVCLCIHWMVQNRKLHPFLIHAGSVFTLSCVLFFLRQQGTATDLTELPAGWRFQAGTHSICSRDKSPSSSSCQICCSACFYF